MCSVSDCNVKKARRTWNGWLDPDRERAPGDALLEIVRAKLELASCALRKAGVVCIEQDRHPCKEKALPKIKEEDDDTEDSGEDEVAKPTGSSFGTYISDGLVLAQQLAALSVELAHKAAAPHLESHQEARLLQKLSERQWKGDKESQQLLQYFAAYYQEEASFTSDREAREECLARAQLYVKALDELADPDSSGENLAKVAASFLKVGMLEPKTQESLDVVASQPDRSDSNGAGLEVVPWHPIQEESKLASQQGHADSPEDPPSDRSTGSTSHNF